MRQPEDHRHTRRITSKGQVTIPVEIRRLLRLEPHDPVVFRIVDGRVELEAAGLSLADTFGAIEPINRPEDFKQLRDVALEEHAEEWMRDQGKDC